MAKMSSFEALKTHLSSHNQGHLLDFYPSLSESEQVELLGNVAGLNVERINSIFQTAMAAKPTSNNVSPLPSSSVDSTISASKEKLDFWRGKGLNLIAQGKVGVILLAGGQVKALCSSQGYTTGLLGSKGML